MQSAVKKVLKFETPSCKACKTMQPAVKKMEDGGVEVEYINAEERPDLVNQYDISSVPTLIFFYNGSPIRMLTGFSEQIQREMVRFTEMQ